MSDYIEKSAKMSDCKYRYELVRQWDKSKGFVNFVGLNPSKANGQDDARPLKDVLILQKIGVMVGLL